MAAPSPTGRVTRSDLESKFRELQGEAKTQAESARNIVLTVGIVVAVLGLLSVFLVGRRSGKKRSTVVEIRRV